MIRALLIAATALAAAAAPDDARLVARMRDYLRVDTTNPPGNEARAADLIRGWLAAEGIESTTYTAAPGRASLVARLAGTGPEPPLMLLHHMDVVPAEGARWKHPPFAAEVDGDAIYGRGALDMKGFGLMQIEAFVRLKRAGVPLRRDVILCCAADEEAGADVGVAWLFAHHPEAIACGEVLNEGGMGLVRKGGAQLMGIQTAERGTFWLRATATGVTGHGSRERPDSATRRLLRALARLEAAPRKLELGPESRAMLRAFTVGEGWATAAALSLAAQDWGLPLIGPKLIGIEPALAPLVTDTINPTVLRAGTNTNVIPGEAAAELDIRLLPGRTGAQTLAWLREVTAVPGDPPLDFEVLHERASTRSPARGPLWDALVAAAQAEYPGIPVMPILTPGGGTDSSFFRDHGVQALGCMPIVATQAQIDAIHGDDEFITREQLVRGARATYDAVVRAAGAR